MRIVIVDDHALVRDGIASVLAAAGHKVIDQCSNGADAIEAVQTLKPDLVLMDISMPGMSGLETLAEIKRFDTETHIVMLTVSEKQDDLMQAIKLGANGYLNKNLETDTFLDTLDKLERGEYAIDPQHTFSLIQGLIASTQTASEVKLEVTPREIEVLQHVANGYSNKEIGAIMSLSTNTIKYHIKKILQKLGVNNRAQAVSVALQRDLIQGPDPGQG